MLPREPGRRGWTVVEQQAYFHRRSVTGLPFEQLQVGTMVAIDLEQGDKGPQASRVEVT